VEYVTENNWNLYNFVIFKFISFHIILPSIIPYSKRGVFR
jgi:hypothetical protein